MSDQYAVKIFSEEDQQSFARLSGDYNPIHIDKVAARRTQAGTLVVHGVHALLWALERLANNKGVARGTNRVAARFESFIRVGDEVVLREIGSASGQTFGIYQGGERKAVIRCARNTESVRVGDQRKGPVIEFLHRPLNRGERNLELGPASFPYDRSIDEYERNFPEISAFLSPVTIRSIASTSYLVGMICPGLHSIFGAITFCIDEVGDPSGLVDYAASYDRRFRRIVVGLRAPNLTADVVAFLRRSPVAMSSRVLKRLTVGGGEFERRRAVIIGGSRGLGAATAAIVTSGGGTALITYNVGARDAKSLAGSLNRRLQRDACKAVQLDVLAGAFNTLLEYKAPITDIYYFATPQIFNRGGSRFNRALLKEYLQYYVESFSMLLDWAMEIGAPISIFYPSSTAIMERPPGLTEYSMAKAAGEVLCQDASQGLIRVLYERLPRVATDQTAAITSAPAADATEVMLPIVGKMSAGTHFLEHYPS